MTPRPHNPDSADIAVQHEREQVDRAAKALLEAMTRHGYSESSRFAVRLALEEALANAFNHGHKALPKGTPIRLAWTVSSGDLLITIQDQGPGFDPAAIPDPTLDENLELPRGRGLMLMRAYMTTVKFNAAGNRVDMFYRKPPAKAASGG